jgi:two-component system invasion response regulator UvrY
MSESVDEIKVLIVDDHPVVREGYRRLLERVGGFRIVGEADTAASAYELYKARAPDVVVMDLSLQEGASGLEALRHIRQWDSRARILVSSMHAGAALAVKTFEAGASGYVVKGGNAREFAEAVRTVAQGGEALSPEIANAIAKERVRSSRSLLETLGPRETEILRQIANGATDQEIATALNLSLKTVHNYHYKIRDKIGARTDAQLVWLAISVGAVEAGAALSLAAPQKDASSGS